MSLRVASISTHAPAPVDFFKAVPEDATVNILEFFPSHVFASLRGVCRSYDRIIQSASVQTIYQALKREESRKPLIEFSRKLNQRSLRSRVARDAAQEEDEPIGPRELHRREVEQRRVELLRQFEILRKTNRAAAHTLCTAVGTLFCRPDQGAAYIERAEDDWMLDEITQLARTAVPVVDDPSVRAGPKNAFQQFYQYMEDKQERFGSGGFRCYFKRASKMLECTDAGASKRLIAEVCESVSGAPENARSWHVLFAARRLALPASSSSSSSSASITVLPAPQTDAPVTAEDEDMGLAKMFWKG